MTEWFKVLGLVCLGTTIATGTICFVYAAVRITFLAIRDVVEEREMKHGKPKHID